VQTGVNGRREAAGRQPGLVQQQPAAADAVLQAAVRACAKKSSAALRTVTAAREARELTLLLQVPQASL